MERHSGVNALRHQVGQLLIAGVEGTSLTAVERAWLKLIRPGGVILFRRNVEDASQTLELLRNATELAAAPLLRCVDMEGGLVDRFRDLIASMPSAAAVAATKRPAYFKKHGRLIARELRALGFNTTFAPVLDLGLPEALPVMRSRVVSPDPQKVFDYAAAFLNGLATERVLGCGKHFPGLGGGTLDSHQAMPIIDRTWEKMWNADLVPFRRLAATMPLVMVAHASYPAVTTDNQPASISRHWITDILRKRIGYTGLIVSDDMEMGGILTQASIEEAAVQSIAAGTDLVEICRDPALILRAYEALLHEAEISPAFRRRVQAAARKVTASKQRLLHAQAPKAPTPATLDKLKAEVKSFAELVTAGAA